jgi:hypothetical protein
MIGKYSGSGFQPRIGNGISHHTENSGSGIDAAKLVAGLPRSFKDDCNQRN